MVTIHSPGFLPRASSAMRSWMSRIERTRPSEGNTLRSPSRSMCAWPSVMPGMTALPLRSTTRVRGPVCGVIASFGPTAMILSPAIAIASVTVELLSMVMTLPLRRMRSAAAVAGAAPWPCAGLAHRPLPLPPPLPRTENAADASSAWPWLTPLTSLLFFGRYTYARAMPRKSSAFRLAPPTSAPSTLGTCSSSRAFDGLTEPP